MGRDPDDDDDVELDGRDGLARRRVGRPGRPRHVRLPFAPPAGIAASSIRDFASEGGDPFSGGDHGAGLPGAAGSGDGGNDQWALRAQMEEVPYELIIHTGDVAYETGTLDQYEAGITITSVSIINLDYPQGVQAAVNDTQKATNDSARFKLEGCAPAAADGVRQALIYSSLFGLPSFALFMIARRTIKRDLES